MIECLVNFEFLFVVLFKFVSCSASFSENCTKAVHRYTCSMDTKPSCCCLRVVSGLLDGLAPRLILSLVGNVSFFVFFGSKGWNDAIALI